MKRKENEIKEYFKNYIFEFIFNDIQNCIKAKANYTVALALLSYTELLGGLINGTLGLRGESHRDFNKALEYFEWNGDKEYYKNLKFNFRDIDFLEKQGDIYDLFRCGLAHEYFIKGDSFVFNNPGGYLDGSTNIFYCEGCIVEDKGIELLKDGKLRFHNNAYFRDFKNAWIKYYKKLIEEKNEGLLRKFNNSLDRVSIRQIINDLS